MKKLSAILFKILLTGLFITSFLSSCSNANEIKTFLDINSKEAFELIQNKEVLILDVRTPGEYAQGHIKNSILIPVQVLSTDYKKILDYRKKTIFIYCRSGNRSVVASNILISNGFENLYNLKNGIKEWVKQGFAIEK
jgi:rhodanese-related sulfurtransferase